MIGAKSLCGLIAFLSPTLKALTGLPPTDTTEGSILSISNTSYVILETVLIEKQSTQRRNLPVLYTMKTD